MMTRLFFVLSLACFVYGGDNIRNTGPWIRALAELSAASDGPDGQSTLSESLVRSHADPAVASPPLMSLRALKKTRDDGSFSSVETPKNVSAACWRDFYVYLDGLIHQAYWALSMVDASGKIPSGVLLGDFSWPGSFSQCVKVKAADSHDKRLFSGGYCSVTIGNRSSLNPAQQEPVAGPTMQLTVGLCVPDSCTAEDVTGLINTGLYFIPKDKSIGVLNSVRKDKNLPLDSPAIGIMCILSVFGAVLTIATLYDLFIYQPKLYRALNPPSISVANNGLLSSHNNNATHLTAQEYTPLLLNRESKEFIQPDVEKQLVGSGCQVLVSLSIYRSACKLLTTSSAASDLRSVHGIRFISMTWVILGHSFFYGISILRNLAVTLDLVKRFSFQAIINATVSVDTFFLLSGLLLSYSCLKEMKRKEGKINWLLFYFHRFWRLTPPYMLILGTHTALFKYWGEGPFWPQQGAEPYCASNWYLNLLYINNIVKPTEMCMNWSWYLANDMQFFLISPLMLIPLYKSWKYGVPVVLTLLVACFLAAGLISSLNNFGPFPFQAADILYFFKVYYVAPWCRIGPYLVGVLYGYALYRADGKVRIHKGLVLLGWLLAAACCLSVLYGLYGFLNGHELSVHVSALYNATARSVWALGVGWVIFACCTGNGGFVNTILSWEPLIPLSRLTYMAYLVHPIAIMTYYYGRETPLYYTDFTTVYLFLGNVVLSYAIAFVASVTFESPMAGLEKILLSRYRE